MQQQNKQEQSHHLLLVYGTLQQGYYNYDNVLAPLLDEKKNNNDVESAEESKKSMSSATTTNNNSNSGNKFLFRARTKDRLTMFLDDFGIPYCLQNSSGGEEEKQEEGEQKQQQITGEIFQVNEDALSVLDELEGTNKGRYVRMKVQIEKLNDNKNDNKEQLLEEAFMYLIPSERRKLIPFSKVKFIDHYDLVTHKKYVPPGEREALAARAPKQNWGGYLFS